MLAKTNKGLNESVTSLQATAGRRDASLHFMKTRLFQTTLAPASGA
jgi:hypothetical protein